MALDTVYHLHFGAGKLGLGLIVPTIIKMSEGTPTIKTIIVARYGKEPSDRRKRYEKLKEMKFYELQTKTKTGTTKSKIEDFELIYSDAEGGRLQEYLTDPKTLLITTSVGGGLDDIAEDITKGIVLRSKTGVNPLLILACENLPLRSSTLYDYIIDRLRSKSEKKDQTPDQILDHIVFGRTIADKICPEDPYFDDDKVVLPPVEADGRLVVLKKGVEGDLLSILREPLIVVDSEEEFDFLEKQKTWLVNGVQFVLSLFATKYNASTLQGALQNEEVSNSFRLMQEAYGKALFVFGQNLKSNSSLYSPENIREFSKNVLERLTYGPKDTPGRILKEISGWDGSQEKYHKLMIKVALRLIEPLDKLLNSVQKETNLHMTVATTKALVTLLNILDITPSKP